MKLCIEKNIKSGGYLEFLPGEYQQIHWNENSIFLKLEVFDLIEPVFKKHLRDSFSPYGITKVSKSKCGELSIGLNNFSTILRESKSLAEVKEKLDFSFPTSKTFEDNFKRFKKDLPKLIDEFVQWLNTTISSNEQITILGV